MRRPLPPAPPPHPLPPGSASCSVGSEMLLNGGHSRRRRHFFILLQYSSRANSCSEFLPVCASSLSSVLFVFPSFTFAFTWEPNYQTCQRIAELCRHAKAVGFNARNHGRYNNTVICIFGAFAASRIQLKSFQSNQSVCFFIDPE